MQIGEKKTDVCTSSIKFSNKAEHKHPIKSIIRWFVDRRRKNGSLVVSQRQLNVENNRIVT